MNMLRNELVGEFASGLLLCSIVVGPVLFWKGLESTSSASDSVLNWVDSIILSDVSCLELHCGTTAFSAICSSTCDEIALIVGRRSGVDCGSGRAT